MRLNPDPSQTPTTTPTTPSNRFTAELVISAITAVRLGAGGLLLTENDRRDLLMKHASGEPLPLELEFDAVAYVQRVTPNRNFVRFAKGKLRSIAKTFAGVPFLLNHDWDNQSMRMGTITASGARKTEAGDVEFVMTSKVVKQHAILSVLDGTIDRFSIGWLAIGPVVCSCHGFAFYSDEWFEQCYLYPGETDPKGRPVEAVFTDAQGVELSSVNVPAVVGTGIDQVRATLSAMSGNPPPRGARTMITAAMKQVVGLAADATDQQYFDRVAALAAATASHEAAAREAQSAREQAEARAAAATAASDKLRVNQGIENAYGDGRLAIVRDAYGTRIPSALELELRTLGATDVAGFERFIGALPRQLAAAQSSLAAGGDDVRRPAGAGFVSLRHDMYRDNPNLKDCLAQMSLTEDELEEAGPHHRQGLKKGTPVPPHLTSVFRSRFPKAS